MLRMTLDPDAFLRDRSRQWCGVLDGAAWDAYRGALAAAEPQWRDFFTGLESYAGSWNPAWSSFGRKILEVCRCLFQPGERPSDAVWSQSFDALARLSVDYARDGFPDALFVDLMKAQDTSAAWLRQTSLPIAGIVGSETLGLYFDLTLDYETLVTIPARGGSKGIPRKALQPLGGMPLLAHTIRSALAIRGVDRVIVNTDDPEIRDVALAYGAEAPFLRPAELAGDDSCLSDALAWQRDWLREHEHYIFHAGIILSPTNPFRRQGLINRALDLALADPLVSSVSSVVPVRTGLDNAWILKDGRCRPAVQGWTGEGRLMKSTFSFTMDFSQRYAFQYHPRKNLYFPVNNLEGIDIDEPDDLAIAKMVVAHDLELG